MGWIKKGIAAIKRARNRRDERKAQQYVKANNLVPVSQAQTMQVAQGGYQIGGTGIVGTTSGSLSGLQQVAYTNPTGGTALTAPAMSALNTLTQQQQAPGGILPWWRGPGGKLQFPWNDPRVPEFLKQFALDDAYLKTYYRAPKGYVIIRDPQGRPYAVMKQIAQKFGLWSPTAKPPISATDWKHYKRNQTIEKKLIKIARPALRKRKPSGGSTPPKKR